MGFSFSTLAKMEPRISYLNLVALKSMAIGRRKDSKTSYFLKPSMTVYAFPAQHTLLNIQMKRSEGPPPSTHPVLVHETQPKGEKSLEEEMEPVRRNPPSVITS